MRVEAGTREARGARVFLNGIPIYGVHMADDKTGEIEYVAKDKYGFLIYNPEGETFKMIKTNGNVKIEYAR